MPGEVVMKIRSVEMHKSDNMMFPEDIQEFDAMQLGQRIQKIRRQKRIKSIDMVVQVDISKN